MIKFIILVIFNTINIISQVHIGLLCIQFKDKYLFTFDSTGKPHPLKLQN